MAGVKGKSGGPRKNAGGARKNSGGARPGAGRKPKEKPPVVPLTEELAKLASGQPFDPRPILEQIALGLLEVNAQQYKALTALLPYVHAKKGEGGKKDDSDKKQKAAAGGRFGPRTAPKVVASGGKLV